MGPRNCIYISAGDHERFASYSLEHLAGEYDIIINYYGSDEEKRRSFSSAKALVSYPTTKFISLKKCYDELVRDRYEWVAVFDDDAMFTMGSIDDLLNSGERHALDIVSPVHDTSGRVSHRLHLKTKGDHDLRLVNFVEMNFPVFKNSALAMYMDEYDGRLCGWGNDWWYCNVLGTDRRLNAGVVDRVVVENPNTSGEMDCYMDAISRMEQWIETRNRLGLKEWDPKTVGFIWDR